MHGYRGGGRNAKYIKWNKNLLTNECSPRLSRTRDNDDNKKTDNETTSDHYIINSSPPSAAYMRQWIGWALVQLKACRLFGAKPLSKPMLGYCSDICHSVTWTHIQIICLSHYLHHRCEESPLNAKKNVSTHARSVRWSFCISRHGIDPPKPEYSVSSTRRVKTIDAVMRDTYFANIIIMVKIRGIYFCTVYWVPSPLISDRIYSFKPTISTPI